MKRSNKFDTRKEAGLNDVVDRIVRKVRDSELAQRMIDRVTRYFHTQNPADDLMPQEVRGLYRDEDYGDEFDVKGDRELDVGWTDHAEYRSDLRDIDPSKVNEAVRDFADAHPGVRRKVKLIKPGVGKAVVDVDATTDPEEAAVVTVMASETERIEGGGERMKTKRYGKVVEKVARSIKAMPSVEDVLYTMENASGTAYEANRRFQEIYDAMKRGNYNEAFAIVARLNSRVKSWLPYDVVEFLQVASKKEPGTESWRRKVLQDMEVILVRIGGADVEWGPYYLTYREDSSNKFHYFAVFSYQDTTGQMTYVGANAFGRIGKPAKVFEIIRTPSKNVAIRMTEDKMQEKKAKGYEEER
jgi:hypothetical protein